MSIHTSEMADPAIFVYDDEGLLLSVNSAATAMTGYTEDELLLSHFHMLFPTDQAARVALAFERKRKEPTLVTDYQADIERKNGLRLTVSITSRHIGGAGSDRRFEARLIEATDRGLVRTPIL